MRILFDVLSGPYGWQLALWFAVLINVNLAILNCSRCPCSTAATSCFP